MSDFPGRRVLLNSEGRHCKHTPVSPLAHSTSPEPITISSHRTPNSSPPGSMQNITGSTPPNSPPVCQVKMSSKVMSIVTPHKSESVDDENDCIIEDEHDDNNEDIHSQLAMSLHDFDITASPPTSSLHDSSSSSEEISPVSSPRDSMVATPITIKKGRKGYGVTLKSIRVYIGDSNDYRLHHIIESVDKKGPAWKAGLRPDQLITHINGESIIGLHRVQVMTLVMDKKIQAITVSAIAMDQTNICRDKQKRALSMGHRIGKLLRDRSSESGKVKQRPDFFNRLRNKDSSPFSDSDEDDDNNEEFIKGIEKAITESDGKINRNLAHMMFVGPPGSGKSSLMDRLLGRPRKKFSKSTGVCDSIVIVDIDTANPSTFHSVAVTDTDTWEEIDCSSSFMSQLSQGNTITSRQETLPTSQIQTQSEEVDVVKSDGTESTATVQPLGTASYQLESTPLPAPAQLLIKKYGRKDLNNLKKTSSLYLRDTGGQVEFQEMLALLVCGPSIFIFVFRADLDFTSKFEVQYRKSAKESLNIYTSSITAEEALLQSLASVYAMDTSSEDITHQSLVFIVATHIDMLGSEREAKIAGLNQHLDSLIKTNGFSHLVHYIDECKGQVVFEVDNASDNEDNFQLFRSRINGLMSYNKDFSIEYPINYLFFCLELQEIKRSVLTLEEVTDIAAKYEIIGEDKVLHLLQFLHIRIGLIRHFNVAGIRHIIVREPQVLFDRVTDLIVKTFSSHFLLPGQKTDFVKKGILRVSVLKSIVSSDDKISPEEFLLLLVHLRIAAPFHVEGDIEERYFIPCILNHVCSESTKEDLEMDIAPLCVKFKCNHCPKGIFGVLVTHLMQPEGDDHNMTFALLEDKIYKDQVSFEVDLVDEIVLKLLPSHLEISFLPDSSDDRDSPIKEVCNNVRIVLRKSILRSFKDLHYNKEKVEPVMCFKCEQCSALHPVIKGKEHHKIKCRKLNKTSRIPPNGRCWYNEEDDNGCDTKVAPSQTGSIEGNSSSVGVDITLTRDHHHQVTRFLNDINNEQIMHVGSALGLHYAKLQRMRDLPGEMVAAWLREDDHVTTASGRPCWASMVRALKEVGHQGLAAKINEFSQNVVCDKGNSGVSSYSSGPPCDHQQQHTCTGISCGTLFKELFPLASEWQDIGTMLDIPDGDLEDIQENSPQNQRNCLREMIKVWLKMRDPEPTWERLVEAVDVIDPKRAQEIKSKYIART